MTDAATEKPRAARPPKKISIFIISMIVFVLWKTLQIGGFCFSEARFLSDKELIARYLAGTDYDPGSFAAIALEQPNFGDCCRITFQPAFLDTVDLIGNAVIFNRRLYGVDVYLRRTDDAAEKEPYLEVYGDIEACGRKMNVDVYSMPISEKVYQSSITRMRKYREGLR